MFFEGLQLTIIQHLLICNSPIFSISRLGAEIEIVQILEKFYSRALDQVKSQI